MVAVQHAKLVNDPISNIWVMNQVSTQWVLMTKTTNAVSGRRHFFLGFSQSDTRNAPFFEKSRQNGKFLSRTTQTSFLTRMVPIGPVVSEGKKSKCKMFRTA